MELNEIDDEKSNLHIVDLENAIDIKDKKCVRLVKGDFDNKTEYMAGKYKEHGFKQ